MFHIIKGNVADLYKLNMGEHIIIHCCNDDGNWNHNVFSTLLSNHWKEAERSYKSYYRSMRLGDIRLSKIDNNKFICNLIARHCDSQTSRPRPIDFAINPQKVCDYCNHKTSNVVFRHDAVDVGLRRLRQSLGGRKDVSVHVFKVDLKENWNRFYESLIKNFKDSQNNIYIYE